MEQDVHILVVDDELVIRHLLSEVLHDDGYDVTTAEDGAQGLACYHRRRPDLVISDTHMPCMDGPALVRRLRATDPSLPIILLNSAPEKAAQEDEQYPMTARISKPFDLVEIRHAVNQVRIDDGTESDRGCPDLFSRSRCRIEMADEPPTRDDLS